MYFKLICGIILISSTYTAMSALVLSSHVLDTSTGLPAAGVNVELFKNKDESWLSWHNTVTNADGRVTFPFTAESMAEGTYKLVFKVEDYYRNRSLETIYPQVEIVFKTKANQHYHIPLLLSPYGYTTYRGS